MFRFVFICACLFGEKTEVLFHLHDAGETNAFLPVIKQLETDYLVVTTGVSAHLLASLPKERLRSFAEYPKIEPSLVITGVSTEMQGEVLEFFREKGIPTWAYWDNFNADGESPYFKTAHLVEPKADVLLLPCASLAGAFVGREVRVVGHPTLDAKLPSRVILWIGGYGKAYDEAFALFQEGMSQMSDAIVIHQHHPKTGEKNLFKLSEAMRLADLVVCHQSTAAFQALAFGKPVLHVVPEGQEFDSLPLQKGLAGKVSRVEDFARAVAETVQMDISGFFDLMGIPQNSTEVCKREILEKLD